MLKRYQFGMLFPEDKLNIQSCQDNMSAHKKKFISWIWNDYRNVYICKHSIYLFMSHLADMKAMPKKTALTAFF